LTVSPSGTEQNEAPTMGRFVLPKIRAVAYGVRT